MTLLWSGIGSAILFKIVDLIVGLRVSVEAEREGLDLASHGEAAYHNYVITGLRQPAETAPLRTARRGLSNQDRFGTGPFTVRAFFISRFGIAVQACMVNIALTRLC